MKYVLFMFVVLLVFIVGFVFVDVIVDVLLINWDLIFWLGFYIDVVVLFEVVNLGVKVNLQFMEDEVFKQKLFILLQFDVVFDMFFSWFGGVFYE